MHFNNSLLAFTLLGAAVCADPLFSFEHPLGPVRDAVVVLVAPNNQLIYKPNQIEVAVGTEIQFIFQDGNHTFTESTFDMPCGVRPGGIASGFVPENTNTSVARSFSFIVRDSEPIYFHCSQATHCQAGLVGIINPPKSGNGTFEQFFAAAKLQAVNKVPEFTPVGGILSGNPDPMNLTGQET